MGDKMKAIGAATPMAEKDVAISPLSTTDEMNNSLPEGSIRQPERRQGIGEPKKFPLWPPEIGLHEAEAWAERNPEAWAAMVTIATGRAARGQRVGTQDLIEFVRWHDFTDADGKCTRVNNNLSPALARLLYANYPQVRPYMDLRRSRFDANRHDGGDHD